jgi:hypothetical protein
VKYAYKKTMSSFEILENSFGGSFPSAIELEAPPNISVTIAEGNFIQNLIIALGCIKQFRTLHSFAVCKFKTLYKKSSAVTADTNLMETSFINIVSHIVAFCTFPRAICGVFKKSEYEPYGETSSFMKNHIYLYSKNIQKIGINVNQVIGHENIHILQIHNGDLDIAKRVLDKERVNRYCELNLRANIEHQSKIKYLLSKVEIEARVHELVSGFYIITQHLPINRKEFLVCLLSSDEIVENLIIIIHTQYSKSKILMDLLSEIKKYSVVMSIDYPVAIRTDLLSDITGILMNINSSQQLFNFISFELPSYYCNVLKLYGSNSASSKLQNEINKERQIHDLNSNREEN